VKLIADALDAYAASSTKTFSDDRRSTVGASEIGQCARKIFWKKNTDDSSSAQPDDDYVDTWGARQRGTVFEDRFWYPAMRAKYGKRLKYAGRYQRTFVHNFISATPDGLLAPLTPEERDAIGIVYTHPSTNCVLVECKTIDPRSTITEPKRHHIYQTHVQMGTIRETTDYWPEYAIISYVDASFWSEVTEFVIKFDESIYRTALDRAASIMTDTALPAPEGWIGGGHECRTCPFLKSCGIERRNLPYAEDNKPVDPQFAAEIADRARSLKAFEQSRDRDDAMVRNIQNEIKDRLREKGVRKIPGVITWSAVKGRSGYDNKAVLAAAQAAGVDVTQFETTGEPSDRLAILVGVQTEP
jgi:hypothetical protein